MTNLRIAQVSPLQYCVPPKAEGGTERVVADLSDALTALGHDVTVFAAEGSSVNGTLASQGLAVADRGGPPGLKQALETVMLADVAERQAEFDVIHFHTEFAHALIGRTMPDKSLTTLHWRTDEADRQAFFAGIEGQSLIAISRAQAASVPPPIIAGIVHHGIAEGRYAPGPGGPHAAFLGRMTDQKGPDRAIRIAAAAGCGLVLGGDRDIGNPRYFDERVAPLLGDRARYIGPVDDAAKQSLLGEACALLFPIDWPEPFGLVMIEAMACGTPVVAFGRGSVPEIVENGLTGFVVDTEEEAVSALRAAANLDRAAVRGRFEQRFGAARMARDYEAVYRGMAERRAAA